MDVGAFVHGLRWEDLPESVRLQALRCLLDTLGAAIGGRRTELSRIIHDYAAVAHGGGRAPLWLDGRGGDRPRPGHRRVSRVPSSSWP